MKDTRIQLLEATINSVVKHGFEDCSMRKVAAAAKLSASNAYYYFENKEDMLIQAYYYVDKEIDSIFSINSIDFDSIVTDRDNVCRKAFYKFSEFMLKNGNHSVYYYMFRDNKLFTKAANNYPKDQLRNLNFTEIEKAVEEKIPEIKNVTPGLVWRYVIEMVGILVKKVLIRGDKPTDKDLEYIYKLTIGGLLNLLDLK